MAFAGLTRRRLVITTCLLTLLAAPFVVVPVSSKMCWVGATNLQVIFTVSDAETHEPVEGATVEIQAEGGDLCHEEERQFTLTTDRNGEARHLCKQCLSSGTSSLFKDTFSVHLPCWQFRVLGAHHEPTEWAPLHDPPYLRDPPYRRQVGDDEGEATLVVPVSLRQSPR